ncbi:DUF4065 domain-containing protein [Rhodopseudomonas sp. P1]|uniref:Panacea domain-containing protein n=1 Tax=Rhodopseudomonas sp. P1 TaxID=3434357 RepID=UPI0031FC5883
MTLKTYAASDVAKFILSMANPEENDFSNLKLQKLCYYAQGLATSMRGVPLFKERIAAWDHGPVVEALYHQYKMHKADPIPPVEGFDPSIFDGADQKAIADIVEHFGQYSAWGLRGMTHNEPPWANAYNQAPGTEISVESMVDYFRPMVDDEYVKRIYGQVQGAK